MGAGDGVHLPVPGLTGAVVIGTGGFGTVYRVEQPSLSRTVAIKVLRGAVTDPLARMRFEREARAMGMLSTHPGIVSVYESGVTDEGHPYLLMALMGGGSLGDRLEREGPMPWQEVLAVAVVVCGALETAHQAGVLHRDLKPENILVSDFGEHVLADFGIARLRGSPQTSDGSLTGSLAHLAPELLDGIPPSVASDLYGLGSTLHMLLTGRAPFEGEGEESHFALLIRLAEAPPPDLRAHDVPEAVASYVEHLMAKRPEERPRSALAAGRAAQRLQAAAGLPETAMVVREEAARAAGTAAGTVDGIAPLPLASARGGGVSPTDGGGPQDKADGVAADGQTSTGGGWAHGMGRTTVMVAGLALLVAIPLAMVMLGRPGGEAPMTTEGTATGEEAGTPSDEGPETDRDGAATPATEDGTGCDLWVEAGAGPGDGTAEAPHPDLVSLLAAIEPGETGCVRDGSYDDLLDVGAGGEPGAPLRIVAAPDARPLLRGGVFVPAGVGHVHIEGFEISRPTAPTVTIHGQDVALVGNDITGVHTCVYIGDPGQGLALNTVLRENRIADCGDEEAGAAGISVGWSQTARFVDNAITGPMRHGIVLYPDADNTTIMNNTIVGTATGVEIAGDEEHASSGTAVTRNVIVATGVAVRGRFDGPEGENNRVSDNCLHAGGGPVVAGVLSVGDNVEEQPGFDDAGTLVLRAGDPCTGRGWRRHDVAGSSP